MKVVTSLLSGAFRRVEDSLPDVEPNTSGQLCLVMLTDGSTTFARYTWDLEPHDDPESAVDTKYWSNFEWSPNSPYEFAEHYQVQGTVLLWMPIEDDVLVELRKAHAQQ